MNPGDLVRTRIQKIETFEFFANERITVNVFPHSDKLCSSIGKMKPHHLGIILKFDIQWNHVNVFITESGVTGWVNKEFLEVINEHR